MTTITQKILSCHTYDALPNRHIIQSPFRKKRHISFGIILWCESTDECLLVRSQQSYAYNLFLSGMYRKTDLKNILTNMTQSELTTIYHLFVGAKTFEQVYKGSFLCQAQDRFYDIRPFLKPYLLVVKGNLYPHWTFPKGRMEHRETPFQCALREFNEEAGFDLTKTPGVSCFYDNMQFSEVYTSFDHEIYETQCWFMKIDHPIVLTQPQGEEIAERKWVKISEINTYLSSSKQNMLNQALLQV